MRRNKQSTTITHATSGFDRLAIAPCGMNCGTCLGFLRDKNKCKGCRITDDSKPNYCKQCIIINCQYLADTDSGFCYDCPRFPCKRLRDLDKRYRTKYSTSLIGNLQQIQLAGIDTWIALENDKWRCPTCGGTICIHRGYCLNCNK